MKEYRFTYKVVRETTIYIEAGSLKEATEMAEKEAEDCNDGDVVSTSLKCDNPDM